MLHTVADFLLNNGIGQNISAALLLGAPSAIFAKIKVWPHVKKHHELVKAVHSKLHDNP